MFSCACVFFSASVVCALIERRINCTRQQNEGLQSQAVMEGAGWVEYVVVSLACWLEGRAETDLTAFSCSRVLRKKQHRGCFTCKSSHFPGVGFYVAVASSTVRYLDRLMFNTSISQEYI